MFKKIDYFIVCLLASLLISAFTPLSFVQSWHDSIAKLCNVGIALIFFFYGLKMNKSDLRHGLSNYRLHLIVQVCTFVIFPLLAFLLKPLFVGFGLSEFWLGFLFLAALPSTVSSSVVMVSIAKGNMPAAIFNASISGLIGVLVTPLWMNFSSNTSNLSETFLNLCITILIPVCLGFLLNRLWGKWATKHKKALSNFDKGIILLIVFNSFSEAFSGGIFKQFSLFQIALVGLFVSLILALIYGLILLTCRAFHFAVEDEITACFCGSKKSLIHGSVMVQTLFKSGSSQALVLLPVMIYHSVQLIIISFIAQRYANRNTGE
ncbi:MAG: bile acid:sodium symporter family protein [Mangrovibacterium sp.]